MPLSEELLEQAVADGIINRDFHDQLLVKSGKWSRIAGIPERDILLRLSQHCSDTEQNYFRKWRDVAGAGCYGLMFTGHFAPEGTADVGLRMRTLTATFMRHYIDARVRSCEKAIDIECTVLCLPDFGAELSEYVRSRIGPMILARATDQQPTIVHVADKNALKKWGKAVAGLIEDSFVEVDLGA